jgi:RNA-splicing ligase RtcB
MTRLKQTGKCQWTLPLAAGEERAPVILYGTRELLETMDEKVLEELKSEGIVIRAHSLRGAAEEAPGAYKDVDVVAEATEQAKLAKRVVRLKPLACVKG